MAVIIDGSAMTQTLDRLQNLPPVERRGRRQQRKRDREIARMLDEAIDQIVTIVE